PPGRVSTRNGLPQLGIPPAPTGTVPSHSWVPFVLPYLEQQALYEQYRRDVTTQGWAHPLNRPDVTKNHLKIMQCPSAKANRLHIEAYPATANNAPGGSCIDCAAIKGIRTGAGQLATSGFVDPVANAEGVMPDSEMLRIADITDGTSNTVMIAECAGRPELW